MLIAYAGYFFNNSDPLTFPVFPLKALGTGMCRVPIEGHEATSRLDQSSEISA